MPASNLCVVCNHPVPWHFEDGRTLDCAEVEIRLTGVTPKYTSCTSPQMWRDIEAIGRHTRRTRRKRPADFRG